jgi:hypothetical protein
VYLRELEKYSKLRPFIQLPHHEMQIFYLSIILIAGLTKATPAAMNEVAGTVFAPAQCLPPSCVARGVSISLILAAEYLTNRLMLVVLQW